MQTWHIWIKGQVQGVGFRPFVYQMAKQFGLLGWVNNTVNGVHIEFNATRGVAQNFYQRLLDQAPILSRITAHEMEAVKDKFFEKFQIIESTAEGEADLLLPPDVAICPNCREELHDPKNRRYQYPFITCTDCGVRFSIISALPYDRERTTMHKFKPCRLCEEEYNDPRDRRYYSQTNSCPSCSIALRYFDVNGGVERENIIQAVLEDWEAGEIVAIKGVGGYLLTCAADQPGAIQRLRKKKYRPTKAFAVMFPDLKNVEKIARIPSVAMDTLGYPVAAITLLEMRERAREVIAVEDIAPGLKRLGVFLPYAPLYEVLLKAYGKAIVATSGNISNAPIVFRDEHARKSLFSIADKLLANNRDIVIPQDDSVVQFSPTTEQPIILRRARGWAPTFIQARAEWPRHTILATGAMLKSTFTLLHRENVYISQYLGDLQHFDTEQHYQYTIAHYLDLLGAQPEKILTDQHPTYPSKLLGKKLAEEWDIPLVSYQHHIAHFAAVLGENHLVDSAETILGVIWDGTGWGSDGQIWGGEFFKYHQYKFERITHWPYQQSFAGDKMAREPRISALAFFGNIPKATKYLKPKFSDTEWQVYEQLRNRPTSLQTSSIGRLFDAVSSILDLMDKQTYEGEAAMQLEALALDYFKRSHFRLEQKYTVDWSSNGASSLLSLLIDDLREGVSRAAIAAKFHLALVDWIEYQAQNLKLQGIAFSGGVFQNGLLVDICIKQLAPKYQLYWHQQLSPNDENISYGQLICSVIQEKAEDSLGY
jgi:hydrogenase maturation protein HypF